MKNNTQTTSIKHSAMMLLTSFIWGTTFVAQSIASDILSPLAYNATRSVLACIFLGIVIAILDRTPYITKKPADAKERRFIVKGGVICGLLLTAAIFCQQYGLAYTTAGKSSFITAFYIILVPVFGIFLKKRTTAIVKLSVAIALVGLYLLCITDEFSINHGDFFMLICAVIFTLQIMAVDYFSPGIDGIRLSFVQFLTVSVVSGVLSLIFEQPSLGSIVECAGPIIYAGIFSSGIAYTLQILAQQGLNPTVAALLMSMESLFGAVSSAIVLGERMTGREILGSALMFAAIILSQLPVGAPKEATDHA
ncbi:MAG: DMT family transporter [Eubacterium sp.]|nr:DMT family transporter [Eubacterium sp.]